MKYTGRFPRGTKDDFDDKENKRMPPELFDAALEIFNRGDNITRENLEEELMWQNPAWSKYMARSRAPLDIMLDPRVLNQIKDNMSLTEKRKLLTKAAVDVGHLRLVTLNKMTRIRGVLNKQGHSISYNKNGLQRTRNKTLESTAESLLYILAWNRGQMPKMHELVEKFSDECQDRKLVAFLNQYTNEAFHEERLPDLTKRMEKEARGK